MTDRITLLNRALLRIGANPLDTEADPGAPQHLAVYDSVHEDLFAKPWSFGRRTGQLVRLSVAPAALWLYAYQLPSDRMAPPRSVYRDAQSRRAFTDYDLQGDMLLTDEPQVWATWLRKIGWERWPGDFREAFTVCLMAELALSVREDRALHDRLYEKARGTKGQNGIGGLVGAALDNDNQQIPSTPVGGGASPLIDARGDHPLDVDWRMRG